MEKYSEPKQATKIEAAKTKKPKVDSKYEGVVAVPFKIKKKNYSKGDVYSTSRKRNYDYLIEQGKINPKNNKR